MLIFFLFFTAFIVKKNDLDYKADGRVRGSGGVRPLLSPAGG